MFNERLEKIDPSTNTSKFYEIKSIDGGFAFTSWGRINTKGQSKKVSHWKASQKLREKLNEGYVRAGTALMNPAEVSREKVEAVVMESAVAGFNFGAWLEG